MTATTTNSRPRSTLMMAIISRSSRLTTATMTTTDGAIYERSGELVQQCLRIFQIGRVEALREPEVDRSEQVAGFGVATLVAAEAGEARRGAQFPELGFLLPSDAQGF